jgi:hypothetical protein
VRRCTRVTGCGSGVYASGKLLALSITWASFFHAEIAGLFDSVYVSFYKGIGAIAGAALTGPAEFIAEARL